MCDDVFDGLLMTREELFGVVSDPGTKRRLRFSRDCHHVKDEKDVYTREGHDCKVHIGPQ